MSTRFHMRVCAAFLCAVAASASPVSVFLWIDSIEGESTDERMKGWIDVTSVGSGLMRESFVDLPNFSDVVIEKEVDSASPLLVLAAAKGEVIPSAVLELHKAGPEDTYAYFEYRLRDVMVRRVDSAGTSTRDTTESVHLHFARVDWLYRSLDPADSPQLAAGAYWDIPKRAGGKLDADPPVDPLPRVSQVAQQSVEPGEQRSVALSVVDLPSGDHPFSLSVEADPERFTDVSLEGGGADWTLHFTVSPLHSQVSAPVRVDLTDEDGTRSMSFLVVVGGERTPYEGFVGAYYTETELAEDPALYSPLHDESGDGLPLVMAFYFGLNPREFNPPPVRHSGMESGSGPGGGPVLQLSYERRVDEPNVTGRLLGSHDMQSWFPLGPGSPHYEESVQTADNPLFERVGATVTVPGPDPLFLRFEVRISGGE
ncbi:MAG: type VI secretion system tube protein Hcp [Opitutales bacterium]|nr:type VI secretion system tube protein Hcp [Opitutales bacterium]